MCKRSAVFLCLVILALLPFCSRAEGQETVQLEDWQYSRGLHVPDPEGIQGLARDTQNTPPEATPDWKPIELPALLSSQEAGRDYTGWITLRQELPEGLNRALNERDIMALNAGRLLDVSVVCLNTNCFAQLGQQEPYRPGAMRPMLRGIPLKSLQRQNTLYIALYSNGQYPFQFMDPVELGHANAIFAAHRQREIIAFVFLTIYVAWGLYHLLLYSRRPRDRYNLYFGVGSLLLSLYWFTANTTSRDALFADHVELHRRVEHLLLFLIPPFFLAFISEFSHQKTSLATKIYGGYCLLTSALVAVVPLGIMRTLRDVWYGMLGVAFIYMFYFIIREIRRGNREAYFLAGAVLIVVLSFSHDILQSKDLLHTPKIASYAFVVLVSGLAALMASRFMRVTNQVEELNRDLDQKVKDRTMELQETMESLQSLKEQQDGDYYLTSLILGPIGGDLVRSGNDVSILIEQKKKFDFRNHSSEIGGDICVADRIKLGERNYRVLMNGDAMGKSLQGAGGAMVLGTVFRSSLARSRLLEDTSEISPEHWLRQTYIELETVFRPFDGSMMASFLLALVEEETGFAYLLNAEHPWAVLYRNGEARFIETESNLRKIGVTMESQVQDFRIDTFRLHPGDTLILGSDGRDDLWLKGEDRTLNADETLFLHNCEKAEGDISAIVREVKKHGSLSDDLSLLTFRYSGSMKPPVEDDLYEILKTLENSEDDALLQRAIEKSEELERGGAETEESLYRMAAVYHLASKRKHSREFMERAIQQGERLLFRNPDHSRNLMLLVHLYERTGRADRAVALMEHLQELRPGDRRVQALQERIG
ncbi:MAG: SpoIIE family protein phosphatase [Leptospiraceae bacterium]|nr:SpoIIE family protein phosphatase [Leptospiraceae bacterium]